MRAMLHVALFLAGATISFSTAHGATITLGGTIRDFSSSHVDFESSDTGSDPGIVETTLGADGKPVYAGTAGNPTTHGTTAFDQWYRDVAGVNTSKSYAITLDNTLTADPDIYTFFDSTFFPIDGELFGNEGLTHNYHFTYELHSSFTYTGGEKFTFTGDDDLWVFIDDTLVIDLGGVHTAATHVLSLDGLGLTVGDEYDFDLFFAERHTVSSYFRIDTSIALTENAVPEPGTATAIFSGLAGLGLIAIRKRRKAA